MKQPNGTDGTDWRDLAQSMATAFRQFVEIVTTADADFSAKALRQARGMVGGTLADQGVGDRERRAVAQFFQQAIEDAESRRLPKQ